MADKGYYDAQPPQYPQQAAYGQPPAQYGAPGYPAQQPYGQPGYPPQQPYGQPGYPPQQPYAAPQPGYYAQPAPQPQVIVQQQAPQKQSGSDDLCMGCALGACLCCCLDGCF